MVEPKIKMEFFESYAGNIINYDFLNKFLYSSIGKIPRIQKIILNFKFDKFNYNSTITALIALELITSQKSIPTKSNKLKININTKAGFPVGCVVVLRKTSMYRFLNYLSYEVLPKTKPLKIITIKFSKNSFLKTLTFRLHNLESFSTLERHFQYFKILPCLNITIVTDVNNVKELFYLLKMLKLLILIKSHKPSKSKLYKIKEEDSNPTIPF